MKNNLEERVDDLEFKVKYLTHEIDRLVNSPTINKICNNDKKTEQYILNLEQENADLKLRVDKLIDKGLQEAKELHKAVVLPFVTGELKLSKGTEE
jgi:hypothetical protein